MGTDLELGRTSFSPQVFWNDVQRLQSSCRKDAAGPLHPQRTAPIRRMEQKGSIESGKLADFVVVAEDPHEVEPDRIKEIGVVRTFVGEEPVHSKA